MDKNQERVLFDILQDFVNDLSGKKNHLRNNIISSGYVRHVVYGIKGYLWYYGLKITSDDLKDSITLPKIVEEEQSTLEKLRKVDIASEDRMLAITKETGELLNMILRLKKAKNMLEVRDVDRVFHYMVCRGHM